jgi:ADP-ribosylglycohydrolase
MKRAIPLTPKDLEREINDLRDRFHALGDHELFVAWFLRAFVTEDELAAVDSLTGEAGDSGYAVKSLEAALWAFHDAKDFREAVLRAVNLGDDADTTGAVCGQLAGAYWGESGIPQEWREGLARKDMIEKALQGLLGGGI